MSTFRVDILQNRSGGATTLSGQYAAKAWLNFNGTGSFTTYGSANISSITDNAVGDYTPTLTSALSDTGFSLSGMTGGASSYYLIRDANDLTARTVSSARLRTGETATFTNIDPTQISVSFIR